MLTVLHEDADLLVVSKPAGLVCHPTKGDVYSSLISRLRLHAGATPVSLVNRLDRETSGVVLAAKSPVAAAELGRLIETRAVRKEYLAIAHGHLQGDDHLVEAPLGKDEASPVAIKDRVRSDGAAAATRFAVLARGERAGVRWSLLRVEPVTGRKHQIRIHLAHLGHPLIGDKIYGDDATRYLRFVRGELSEADRQALILENHALHAGRLAFSWRGAAWEFVAPPEPAFASFAGLGGP